MTRPAAGGGPKCPTPQKNRHATKAAALKALDALAASKPLGPDWNVYKCVCGVWHIGHRRGSLNQRIKNALRTEPRR